MEVGKVEFSPQPPRGAQIVYGVDGRHAFRCDVMDSIPVFAGEPLHGDVRASAVPRMVNGPELELRKWCVDAAIRSGAETARDVIAEATKIREWLSGSN